MLRFFKSGHSKEPISTFVLTVGTVNIVIGGVDGHWSLALIGGTLVGVAIALRFLQSSRRPVQLTNSSPVLYLPERREK